jgi:hypothetical protein
METLGFVYTESIEIIYRGPGFLAVECLAPNPPPPPPPSPVSKLYLGHSLPVCCPAELTDVRVGEGVGEEPNHTAARKPGRQ